MQALDNKFEQTSFQKLSNQACTGNNCDNPRRALRLLLILSGREQGNGSIHYLWAASKWNWSFTIIGATSCWEELDKNGGSWGKQKRGRVFEHRQEEPCKCISSRDLALKCLNFTAAMQLHGKLTVWPPDQIALHRHSRINGQWVAAQCNCNLPCLSNFFRSFCYTYSTCRVDGTVYVYHWGVITSLITNPPNEEWPPIPVSFNETE